MPATYWIVNLITKQYFQVTDEGTFFDGDWKQKTPWPDEKYVFLSAQKVHTDQRFQPGAFYGYDLSYHGMIVGVYYDKAVVTKKEINNYIKVLRNRHDVAKCMQFPLTKCN